MRNPATMAGLVSRAASVGGHRPRRAASSPAGGFPQDQQPLSPASRAAGGAALARAAVIGVDIAPGIFSATGMSQAEWNDLTILPGDTALNRHLFAVGQRDARAWAELTGLAAAAANRRAGRARGSMAVERGRDTQQP
jgi:hypothetical protein